MAVLDWLQQLLQSSRQTPAPQGADTEGEPTGQSLPRSLPPGLPDAVRRSILTQPSYGEGQSDPLRRVPRQLPFDTQMGREWWLDDRSRTGGDRLYNEMGDWRDFQQLDQPLPEGMRPFSARPAYPSPLNQMFGRLPGMGLY